MSFEPVDCVVDASVAIKLFVDEALSDHAEGLFGRLASDPKVQMYVPDLFYVECANILWKYVWRFGCPAKDAQRSLAQLHQLAVTRVATYETVVEALAIALQHEISVYNACYIAAARMMRVPLVTADERLARKVAAGREQVWWLGDLDMCSRQSE